MNLEDYYNRSMVTTHSAWNPYEMKHVREYHFDKEVFAGLIIKDILRVVAAQALMNESAMDVYKNLTKLYDIN